MAHVVEIERVRNGYDIKVDGRLATYVNTADLSSIQQLLEALGYVQVSAGEAQEVLNDHSQG